MGTDEGLPAGADRLVADVLRTTGSTLSLWLGDIHDFDEPLPPGARVETRVGVANGSVTDETLHAVIAARAAPQAIVWIELDGEVPGGLWPDWPETEAGFALFVDQVLDHLDDELWGGWPSCPQHGAHLTCDVRDDTAVWICSRGEVVSRVGELSMDRPTAPGSQTDH